MSLAVQLSCFALRPIVKHVVGAVLPGVEIPWSEEATGVVEEFFVSRFTDPSMQLHVALGRATDRSWRAVEIALAGESFWSRLTDRGEDKAFRAEIRTFLDANPLQLPKDRDETFRRAALEELRACRQSRLIPGEIAPSQAAARQSADFLRFADPKAACAAEWRMIGEMATLLRENRHAALADLVEMRPKDSEAPLLAVAVRFFFRREIETNPQLIQGLTYDQVDRLGQALEVGLSKLQDALHEQGDRIQDTLALAETIHDNVLDLKSEQGRLGSGMRDIYSAVSNLGEKLDRLHERSLRPADATSIRSGAERQLVEAVKAKFRALPENQRQQVPALLNALGKLELAAGNYDAAHQDFRQVVTLVDDRAGKAAAHHNAFVAALEKKDWPAALHEFAEASRLDPERFALFPLDRYEPERILGAGGFGIVFLCRNRFSKARLVVKALRTDELDRVLGDVLEEAGTLEQLHHDAIIRLRDCGCADARGTRPYLVMDYFDGTALDDFVGKHGPLPAREAKLVARQMAEGLAAAHDKRILHRDVKPGNVLLEQEPAGPRIKLIDFGLAVQQQAVQTTIHNAGAMSNTIRGQSIAGTLEYASPEQMGRLPGESTGPRSDIYGFGRTMCFALFGTPKPGPRHWKELKDDALGELIGRCIEEIPKDRPGSFAEVLAQLSSAPVVMATLAPEEEEPPLPRGPHDSATPPPLPGEAAALVPIADFVRTTVRRLADDRLKTNASPKETMRLLVEALREYGVTEIATDRTTVSGKTGRTFWSHGQTITGTVERVGEDVVVSVTSKPYKFGQIYDWGQGKKEAREILERLIDKLRSRE